MVKNEFSVSMCVYGGDKPEWFKTAVDSVINQTVKPTEIVLVVDGPIPEELDDIVKEYEKMEMFKVIRFEENKGHGEARRESLSNCTNELIAIMDADDICAPNRFELQLKAFDENPEIDIVGGIITEFIGEPTNITGKREVFFDDEEIKEDLKKRCPMNQMTVMFKKSSVEEVGGYIDWYCNEDYYLWIRMTLSGKKFKNLPNVLVNVRTSEDMYQRRGGLKYFKSERKLQKFMKKNKIIGFGRYFINVIKRFIVQVLLPNSIRGWVFKKFARKRATNE